MLGRGRVASSLGLSQDMHAEIWITLCQSRVLATHLREENKLGCLDGLLASEVEIAGPVRGKSLSAIAVAESLSVPLETCALQLRRRRLRCPGPAS